MARLIHIPWYARAYRHLQLHGVAYVFLVGLGYYVYEVCK